MGRYQSEKKSSDLISHLFHAHWPLPRAFPTQAAPCMLATFKGSISTSMFVFTNSNVNVLLKSQVKRRDAAAAKERMLPTSCQAASWVSQIQRGRPGSLCLQFLSALACAVCNLPSVLSANCEFTADPLARSASRLLAYHHPVPWDQPSKWGQPSNDISSTKGIYAFISSQKIPVSSSAAKSKPLLLSIPL